MAHVNRVRLQSYGQDLSLSSFCHAALQWLHLRLNLRLVLQLRVLWLGLSLWLRLSILC
jgi:hypothetical protein